VIEDSFLLELIKKAQLVYEEAFQMQQQGDWAGYGEKIRELEQILADLSSLAE